MSLTDLKRKKPKQIRKAVSVDDFIEDANNYAFGKQTVVGESPQMQQSTQDFLQGLDKKSTKIYRHATFTLTEKSIAQLNELSKTTQIAKSKLLRMLIDDFYRLTDAKQHAMLKRR
ncbi:ribbon-helix-helix domain-containing protein [Shewanella aestuarii]|uniref:Ribbon-helix-helix domain-containing protein n=1 Tax=Shewanella aestuarii TaxID=1028752 RepID=A0A6G9QK65_9GAMM|nr:ribbon-helix-helix domain-containing protein [Shewanella aestuarii]QIR14251.1 ribbon-helix-helix domain-containing protein [Shewanella aestuarii]